MFVDDEAEVRRAVSRLLSSHGLTVDVAGSAQEALRLAQIRHYRVVATDLRMPGMDGLTLIERLRPLQERALFLLVTGLPEIDLRREMKIDASLSIIAKPWVEAEFVRACKQSARPRLGGNLLLIEDNPGDALLLEEYLHIAFEDAYSVRVATSLADALLYLQTNKVDLMIADLGLPDATGLETAKRLTTASPEAPLVILSGGYNNEMALDAIAFGAQDFLPKEQLNADKLRMVIRFALERHLASKRLVRLAHQDSLTGLPNKAMFRARLEHTVAVSRRNGMNFAVMIVDVDRFKPINDTYGHDMGDVLLQSVAARLTSAVRACDTVARLGGDEFGLILDNVGDESQVTLVVQRIQHALSAPIQVDEHDVETSLSIGAVFAKDVDHDMDKLLRAADTAMYRAKRSSGTTFEFYASEASGSTRTPRGQLQRELDDALNKGEFRLHYQPQVGLRHGELVAFEALLRWARPDGMTKSPAEFIPILEDSRLLVPVGRWVLTTACAQLRALLDRGFQGRMAVNVSAVQFESDDLIAAVEGAIRDANIAPDQLELELTESLLMRDTSRVNRMLAHFKASGVRLSIDDFGTGYSSLSYLNRFHVDALKIDRSFTQQAASGTTGASVARAIVGLGHELGLEVVAEGVEEPEQLRFLAEAGCDVVQGYLLGRPDPDCNRFMSTGRSLLPAH
ncbi:MAG TPA: EAL domain-containing protein [Polyangiales bacterium]|nr:EAL domain-containing protein [Polyangiales bacterium]